MIIKLMPMISVIVPVYKVESYISECIDSILRQTYQDLELILVDDGSPDSCGKICDDYAQHDSRIRVIHQENGGVTSARRTGIKQAHGEWICFVDGDDILPENSLRSLYEVTHEKVDIIIGAMDNRKLPDTISLHDYRAACISGAIFSTALWAKLYRRSLFNNWIFDIPRDIIVGEDLLANVRLAFQTNYPPLIVKKIKVYCYRSVPQSVMHYFVHNVGDSSKMLDFLKASIPVDFRNIFRNEYNLAVYRQFSNMVYDNPQDHSWETSALYSYLKDEIREGRFRMSFPQRLGLMPRNRLQLRIEIKIAKLLARLVNNK